MRRQLLKYLVAVEKLISAKIAKMKLRQDYDISDLLESQDIFYPQILGIWGEE